MMTDVELEEVYGTGIRHYAYWILGFGTFVVLTSFCGCLHAEADGVTHT